MKTGSVAVIVSLIGMLIGTTEAGAQQNQATLVRQLRQGDSSARLAAAERVMQMGPASVDPELRDAVITALEAEGALHRRVREGSTETISNPEAIGRLAFVVALIPETSAIPALVGALGTSPPATTALAEFGEAAAGAVLTVAEASTGSVLTDALLTLRFMAEGVGGTLSDNSVSRMRAIARRGTDAQRSATVLWRAIDLAIALGDPGLRGVVESLAADPAAVGARGITDPDLVERTQQRALDRLSGIPALPRWEPRQAWASRIRAP